MERFREDSGDINPLHLDRDYARARGFPDVVVYGLLASSFYSTLVGVYLPGDAVCYTGLISRFTSQFSPGTPWKCMVRLSTSTMHTAKYRFLRERRTLRESRFQRPEFASA
jgi:acyl dehydratase